MSPTKSQKIQVMVSGLPGRMARQTAEAVLENPEEFELVPQSLTGPETEESSLDLSGTTIQLVPPSRREEIQLEKQSPVAIDFTEPAAVLSNVEWYCKKGIAFVLGTTGGDETQVRQKVSQSESLAVLAPNLASPILLIMEALDHLAGQFPGVFEGWSAEIVESHQAGKKDTSGTAKKMVGYLNHLGINFSREQIQKIRDPEKQKTEVGIPEEHLSGHAFHTYRLHSPDGTVALGLSHDVLGRRVYSLGALRAVRFIAEKMKAGESGKAYDMLEVLRAEEKGDN